MAKKSATVLKLPPVLSSTLVCCVGVGGGAGIFACVRACMCCVGVGGGMGMGMGVVWVQVRGLV